MSVNPNLLFMWSGEASTRHIPIHQLRGRIAPGHFFSGVPFDPRTANLMEPAPAPMMSISSMLAGQPSPYDDPAYEDPVVGNSSEDSIEVTLNTVRLAPRKAAFKPGTRSWHRVREARTRTKEERHELCRRKASYRDVGRLQEMRDAFVRNQAPRGDFYNGGIGGVNASYEATGTVADDTDGDDDNSASNGAVAQSDDAAVALPTTVRSPLRAVANPTPTICELLPKGGRAVRLRSKRRANTSGALQGVPMEPLAPSDPSAKVPPAEPFSGSSHGVGAAATATIGLAVGETQGSMGELIQRHLGAPDSLALSIMALSISMMSFIASVTAHPLAASTSPSAPPTPAECVSISAPDAGLGPDTEVPEDVAEVGGTDSDDIPDMSHFVQDHSPPTPPDAKSVVDTRRVKYDWRGEPFYSTEYSGSSGSIMGFFADDDSTRDAMLRARAEAEEVAQAPDLNEVFGDMAVFGGVEDGDEWHLTDDDLSNQGVYEMDLDSGDGELDETVDELTAEKLTLDTPVQSEPDAADAAHAADEAALMDAEDDGADEDELTGAEAQSMVDKAGTIPDMAEFGVLGARTEEVSPRQTKDALIVVKAEGNTAQPGGSSTRSSATIGRAAPEANRPAGPMRLARFAGGWRRLTRAEARLKALGEEKDAVVEGDGSARGRGGRTRAKVRGALKRMFRLA